MARKIVSLLAILLLAQTVYSSDGDGGRVIPKSDFLRISKDLRSQGYTVAAVITESLSNFIPFRSTLLIPTNSAIETVSTLSQTDVLRTLEYHVVPMLASSRALSKMKVGDKLPTLLEDHYLTLTSNKAGNFSLDGIPVTRPNLCRTTKWMTCHAVGRVLNYSSSFAISPSAAPSFAPGPGPEAEFAPEAGPELAPSFELPPELSPSVFTMGEPPLGQSPVATLADPRRSPSTTTTASKNSSSRNIFNGATLMVGLLIAVFGIYMP